MKLSVGGSSRYATFYGQYSACDEDEQTEVSWGTICSPQLGSSGDNLRFKYEVVKGDLDSDGVSISANAVDLNGGTVRDFAGNDAVLTNSATGPHSNFLVDAVPAAVQSVAITSEPESDNTYGCRETIEVTVTFSESVRVPNWYGANGIQMPQLELNIGGVKRLAKTHERSTIIGTSVVFYYTVEIDDQDADGISIGANALKLNGGSIEDNSGDGPVGGEDANISHSAVAATANHKVSTSGCSDESAGDPSDATLSALSLIGWNNHTRVLSPINIDTFASDTTSYTGSVAYAVNSVRIEPTLSNSAASYRFRVNGRPATELFRPIVGSNVIAVQVTSEDSSTTRTYTVTVTRPPASTDATLSGLTLGNIDFGTFSSDTTSYTASVAHSVSETTVTPTVNHSGARRVIKLDGRQIGLTILFGLGVPLSVGSNVFTVEVTAEDGSTAKTYTVTVTRAAASTDATLSGLTLSSVDFGTFASDTASYTAEVDSTVTETTVTPTVTDSAASYVIKLGGEEDPDGTVALAAGSNVITVEVTAEDGSTTKTYTVTVSRLVTSQQNQVPSDATLSGLTLSGIDIGTFASDTTSYTASVAHSLSQTTVSPTVSYDGASHVIKLGGATDTDGVVSLSVGSNVITVEVTAEDGNTTETYTVTVTRAAASTDAMLSGLTLSGIDIGTFASGTTSYTASVAHSLSQTTVSPTVSYDGASHVIKLGGVEDGDGTVALAVGSNVITVEVTAEDGNTTETYTVTVTRAAASTDAMLSGLTLSGIDIGTFASGTTSYTASVAHSLSQTTVSPTVSYDGASHVIKLGGVEDGDGTVALAVGSNVITVEVTAEDDSTTRTYTVTGARSAPPSSDATLSGLTLSGIDFGTFASGTTSYTASVAHRVSQTTVTPTMNHDGASHVIKLGGATDADGVLSLSVGRNVITVEVTSEDGSTIRTYKATITRSAPPSFDATLSGLTLSGIDFGAFASGTTSYTASVAHSVSQTTVTPTVKIRRGDLCDQARRGD